MYPSITDRDLWANVNIFPGKRFDRQSIIRSISCVSQSLLNFQVAVFDAIVSQMVFQVSVPA
jgi:hypothetical protein